MYCNVESKGEVGAVSPTSEQLAEAQPCRERELHRRKRPHFRVYIMLLLLHSEYHRCGSDAIVTYHRGAHLRRTSSCQHPTTNSPTSSFAKQQCPTSFAFPSPRIISPNLTGKYAVPTSPFGLCTAAAIATEQLPAIGMVEGNFSRANPNVVARSTSPRTIARRMGKQEQPTSENSPEGLVIPSLYKSMRARKMDCLISQRKVPEAART